MLIDDYATKFTMDPRQLLVLSCWSSTKPSSCSNLCLVMTKPQTHCGPSCTAGAKLLEQYQAQLVSSLRASLQPGVPPMVSIAGGSLATSFLECGLAAGEITHYSSRVDVLRFCSRVSL